MAVTLQSQLPAPSQRALHVPRQGSWLKLLGGLLLSVSFFLPALNFVGKEQSYTLMSLASIKLESATSYLLIGFVPVFYILGLTTFLLMVYGRFTRRGVSRGLLTFHIIEMTLVVLASGAGLIYATTLEHRFGIILVGPAILAWLALFVQFVATWLMRSQSLMWRVIRSTQLCGGFTFLAFGIVLLASLYNTSLHVDLGLWLASLGSLMLVVGNEPKTTN